MKGVPVDHFGYIAGILLLLTCAISAADTTRTDTARYAFTVNSFDKSLTRYRLDASGMLHINGYQPIPVPAFPTAVGVHPSGRFVFTVSKSLSRIGVYRLDAETGVLTQVPGSPSRAGGRSPFFIAFHPSGQYVYFASHFDGILAFAFNPENGALKPIEGTPYFSGDRTRSLVMHPSGRFLYATNAYSNTVSAYAVDPTTGKLTGLDGSPFQAGDKAPIDTRLARILDYPASAGGMPYYVAMHPSGRFLYVTNWLSASVSAFRIDQDSGVLSLLKGFPRITGINPYAVTVHPSGQFLYVTNWADNALWGYRINSANGDLTLVPGSPFAVEGIAPVAITFDPLGQHAYVPNYHSNSVSVFDVNTSNGILSLQDTLQTRSGPWSLALMPGPIQSAPTARRAFGLKGKQLVMLEQSVNSGELTRLTSIKVGGKPSAVVARRDGHFVYVADAVENRIHGFRAEGDKLTLVPGSPFPAGKGLRGLSMDINGLYLYAVNEADNSLSEYAIDAASGTLSEIMGSPFATGHGPMALTLDAASRYVFVANSDAGAGSVSVFRYQTNRSPLAFEIDKYGSPFAAGKHPVALAEDPTGKHLYVVDAGTDRLLLFGIDPQGGVLQALPGSSVATGHLPRAVVVHPSGDWVYVLSGDSGEICRYRRNRLQGTLSEILPRVTVDPQSKILRLDPAGRYLYVLTEAGRPPQHFKVDIVSGALTAQKIQQDEGLRELVFSVFSN